MATRHAQSPTTSQLSEPVERVGTAANKWLAVLRIAIGFVFLWPFLDKLIGLSYATPSAHAWLRGGSPTSGFLGHVMVGPFQSLFHSWTGSNILDWLFMLGLLGVGVAVMLGVALRLSAIAGTVMMLLMWAAEWPLAITNSAGKPSGSTNPIVDYHIIYALALIVVAAAAADLTCRTLPARSVGW